MVYLKINDIDTRILNIKVLDLGAKQPSRLKYTKTQAYGQDGYTKVSEDAYEGFTRTSVLMTSDTTSHKTITDALHEGLSVRVEYSDDDGKYRLGVIESILDEVIVRENRRLTIDIDLQPFRYDEPITLVNPTSIDNVGNVHASPVILVEGTGEHLIEIGNQAMLVDVDGSLIIDCENMEILDKDGNFANSRRISGDFFRIEPGLNEIETDLDIELGLNWRWR